MSDERGKSRQQVIVRPHISTLEVYERPQSESLKIRLNVCGFIRTVEVNDDSRYVHNRHAQKKHRGILQVFEVKEDLLSALSYQVIV